MKAAPANTNRNPRQFRRRLGLTLMAIVGGLTLLVLVVAQRRLEHETEQRHFTTFSNTLSRIIGDRTQRALYLSERCHALVKNARIHAALEDDALDLLYPSARDELQDLAPPLVATPSRHVPLQSLFYRFLDQYGRVIRPERELYTGVLTDFEANQIALREVPTQSQYGFIATDLPGRDDVSLIEVIATPIASTLNPQGIASLVVGFEPDLSSEGETYRALWSQGVLQAPRLGERAQLDLNQVLSAFIEQPKGEPMSHTVELDGRRYALLYRIVNPDSAYPRALEVVLTPLDGLEKELADTRKRILFTALAALGFCLLLTQLITGRFATPVEALAQDSATHASQRDEAKAALELTQAELDRAARFSANASHQLKTPIAVLRAGLDELLARQDLSEETRTEIDRLGLQTERLTSIIDDLLLLSRLDAGHLRLEFSEVDLVRLIEESIDDLSILPDPLQISWQTHLQAGVKVRGEKRYLVHLIRNLLENAQRYNRHGGTVQIQLTCENDYARLRIGNHGAGIPLAHQSHLFDRFHRAGTNENIPGHGLGLNLARDLARLHHGDLFLAQSEAGWTEFEVNLPLFRPLT